MKNKLFPRQTANPIAAPIIAGVDEVGRGCLAGDVYAAAVILSEHADWSGLRDSKQLTAAKRHYFANYIKKHASAYAIAYATVAEIDRLNILQASLQAMRRAVLALSLKPDRVLIDGNRLPADLPCEAQAIVKGDQKVAAIAAASILAKVSRDDEMCRLAKRYPDYGFEYHKGYPSQMHRHALQQHGVTGIHRRSFKPVKAWLAQQDN